MRMKKLLSLFLALVMVLSLVPATAFATEGEEEDVVYLSISYDSEYIEDRNGDLIREIPIPLDAIAAINYDEYEIGLDDSGRSNMWYDKADPDKDGNYEPTALQLIIYAHENLYGGEWGDVNFTATPGGSFFNGGVFGFTQNLVYFLNGEFPIDRDMAMAGVTNVGATSDRIILRPGDHIHMSSFECLAFLWSTGAGFHLFTDDSGAFVYDYDVQVGETLSFDLVRSFCDLTNGRAWTANASNAEVFYGTTYGVAEGSVTTDDAGHVSFSFDAPGTHYLWVTGAPDTSESAETLHELCTHGYDDETGEGCVISAPGCVTVTVSPAETPGDPREPQDVSAVLNAAMAQLASTVTAPSFGTVAGEWTVFDLARGGYFEKDNKYFTDYYHRIVSTVNTLASKADMNGALDKTLSTENSRLIVALSAIGKDATSVGNWDLVAPYSEHGIKWIAKQGINGIVWALIALDSNDYEIADSTLRQTLVDRILSYQHNDGGWHMDFAHLDYASNVDVTGMALTALYPYRDQSEVAAACAEAIAWLSSAQQNNGDFAYDESAAGTVESCAWAIVGLTTWGINPDTDPRFVKNGNSAVDALLSYYLEDKAIFEHAKGDGGNAMGTDQGCYGLVAYDRFVKGKTALYDYSDVTFETSSVVEGQPKVTLGLPEEVANDVGTTFNANVSIDQWDSGYKLLDMVMTVPAGLKVNAVTATRLDGGTMSYHLDSDGKLRLVYFDEEENKDITITKNANGNTFPAEMFTIEFEVEALLEAETLLEITINGMSLKTSSDSAEEESMTVVDTSAASGEIKVVEGISYSAKQLYKGDGIDLIPSDKMAVAVAVTGLEEDAAAPKLTFKDGSMEIVLLYSEEMHKKSGVHTYVALVDASIAMEKFVDEANFTLNEKADSAEITFGDSNGDDRVNAEDALKAVNYWLRKDAPTDNQILTANVNGDSRLNTYDALGIVENFVNDSEFTVVTMALSLKPATPNNQ